MKAKFIKTKLYEDSNLHNNNNVIINKTDNNEIEMEEEKYKNIDFDKVLKNELKIPEYSRRKVSFRLKGTEDVIDAIPMVKMKGGAFLMKIGNTFKKFKTSDMIEESAGSNKTRKKLNENSYNDFITSYRLEINSVIDILYKIRSKISDLSEIEYEEIFEKLGGIYDLEVIDWIERTIGETGDITIHNLVNLAIKNQNNNGTEMQMVLNAVIDLGEVLDIYEETDEDEDTDFDENEEYEN